MPAGWLKNPRWLAYELTRKGHRSDYLTDYLANHLADHLADYLGVRRLPTCTFACSPGNCP